MDIDFVYEVGTKSVDLKLKTSLIPDVDRDLIEMMNRRDIKLIRRKGKAVEGLDGDIHIQIAFKQQRLRKDDWLTKQTIKFDANVEEIYTQLAAFRYETDNYLMGWIDKTELIKQINDKPQHLQKWKYGMREFWCCNLERDAKEPLSLIEYLKTKI